MTMPADGVKLDVSGNDWLVQVSVFQVVRVHVTIKHLYNHNQRIYEFNCQNLLYKNRTKYFLLI